MFSSDRSTDITSKLGTLKRKESLSEAVGESLIAGFIRFGSEKENLGKDLFGKIVDDVLHPYL